ncbi:MAG: hypothetical protein FJX29_14025 [Alphaproteobacteria bacterium]|nr:hypothetical protein [Alphaproteobacteria bacterium]
MQGTWGAIALDFVTALAGVWLISAGVAGYALSHLKPPMRTGYIIAGALLLKPAGLIGGGVLFNLAGLVLGAALLAYEITMRRRLAAA